MGLTRDSSAYPSDHPVIVAWEAWCLKQGVAPSSWAAAWDCFLTGWEAADAHLEMLENAYDTENV